MSVHNERLKHSGTYQMKLLVEEAEKRKRVLNEKKRTITTALGKVKLDPMTTSTKIPEQYITLHGGPQRMRSLVDSFVEAALNGNRDEVNHYIRKGIPVNAPHSVLGYTALHAAAGLKDPKIMQYLIHGGADLEITAGKVCGYSFMRDYGLSW